MISHFDGQVAEMVSSLRWQSNPILALFITYFCTVVDNNCTPINQLTLKSSLRHSCMNLIVQTSIQN